MTDAELRAAFDANTAARVWREGFPMRAVRNIAAGRIPAPHPFRHPPTARNGACLDCGEHEEDGPHIAA